MHWFYQKYNSETGTVESCPQNDIDGSITGNVVIGLKEWFDENPEIRIEKGYIKHIFYTEKEDPDVYPQFNHQTQFVMSAAEKVDEYTVKEVYYVYDKTEEMLLLEEMGYSQGMFRGGIILV